MTEYPVRPTVTSMETLFIGGINSSGCRANRLYFEGFDIYTPKIEGNSMQAALARFMPGFSASVKDLTEQVIEQCKDWQPDLIVGSSQGGAIAMNLIKKYPNARLMLLAPAWRTFDVEPIVPKDTIILHGTNDWIVPIRDSVVIKNKSGCTLHELDDGHVLDSDAAHDLTVFTMDTISQELGLHKDSKVIEREWKAYRRELKEWHESAKNQQIVVAL